MCLNVVVAIHSKATAMHTDEPAVLEAFEKFGTTSVVKNFPETLLRQLVLESCSRSETLVCTRKCRMRKCTRERP